MTLKAQIQEDIKQAMRAKDSTKLSALRLLSAAITQKEVDTRTTLSDTEIVAVIEKAIKQRKDSIAQYQAANRQDRADAEQFEINVISAYMPAAMSADELAAVIEDAIATTGAKSVQDIGKVMAIVKPAVAGKADMSAVSATIKAKLA